MDICIRCIARGVRKAPPTMMLDQPCGLENLAGFRPYTQYPHAASPPTFHHSTTTYTKFIVISYCQPPARIPNELASAPTLTIHRQAHAACAPNKNQKNKKAVSWAAGRLGRRDCGGVGSTPRRNGGCWGLRLRFIPEPRWSSVRCRGLLLLLVERAGEQGWRRMQCTAGFADAVPLCYAAAVRWEAAEK